MIKKCEFNRKRIKKLAIQRNSDRTKNIRSEKSLEYVKLLMRGYNFIYIDESGFNDHCAAVYGWSKIGE